MSIQAGILRLGIRLTTAAAEAQSALSQAALEDCNRFCKLDSGELINSSYKSSSMVLGRLVWDTEYARHAYYLGEANKSKNPLASKMWAHKAAALYSEKWQALAKLRFIAAVKRLKGG
jgi:hypothetical protein